MRDYMLIYGIFKKNPVIGNKNQTVQSNESGGCCPANTQSVQPEEKKCCGTQPQPEQEESCCDTTFN